MKAKKIQTEPKPNQNPVEYRNKLDDKKFAQAEYDKFQRRAQTILEEIAFVCEGAVESGWFPRLMAEILDMFMIRHENFERAQFAEDLQLSLFRWTHEYSVAFRAWERKAFAGTDFEYAAESDDNKYVIESEEPLESLVQRLLKHPDSNPGLVRPIYDYLVKMNGQNPVDLLKIESADFIKQAIENENKTSETPALDLSNVSTDHLQTDDCDEIAEQLSTLLKNPKLPAELCNAIQDGLDEIVNTNDSRSLVGAQPDYIKSVLQCALDCSEMPSEGGKQ